MPSSRRLATLLVLGTVLSLVCFGRVTPTQAEAPSPLTESWQHASQLYESGKFADALVELQSQPQPLDDAGYFYNLGTVLLRLGKLGYSLAYLEKANRLKPHDPAVQHNLQIARSALGGALGSHRLDPASTWSEEIADRVTLEEIRGTLGLVGSVMVLMWLRFYLRTRRLRKTFLHPAGLIASTAFVITCALYWAERLAESHPPAVVLEHQVVRSGPGDRYLELGQIESGIKLRVLGPSDKPPETGEVWRQIRYSQDGIGWVRAASLLLL